MPKSPEKLLEALARLRVKNYPIEACAKRLRQGTNTFKFSEIACR